MTHATCRLTTKNRDQIRNPTLALRFRRRLKRRIEKREVKQLVTVTAAGFRLGRGVNDLWAWSCMVIKGRPQRSTACVSRLRPYPHEPALTPGFPNVRSQHANRTKPHRRIGIHLLRTNRALAVIVSPQPISTSVTLTRATNQRAV